jgi:hypothetical protein
MLGIPTTRRYILSFDDGLEQSIARLDAVDTKGKEFFYLLIFVFALTIMTLLVVEFVRHRYNYGNKAKKEFIGMYSIFISFTIGWFLLSSILITWIWEFVRNWPQNLSPDFVKNIYTSVDNWVAGFSTFLRDRQFPDFTRILIQPAFLLVIWMAWKFGHNVLQTWHSNRSTIDLMRQGKTGEAVNRLSVGYWPLVTILSLIVIAALTVAKLAEILFYNSVAEGEISHKESCMVKDTKTEVNFFITNNTSSEKFVDTLYFGFFEGSDDARNRAHPIKIIKIEPTELLWLSNKGTILEENERRYYRLQFANDNPELRGRHFQCVLLNGSNGSPPEIAMEMTGPRVEIQNIMYPVSSIDKIEGDTYSNRDPLRGPRD